MIGGRKMKMIGPTLRVAIPCFLALVFAIGTAVLWCENNQLKSKLDALKQEVKGLEEENAKQASDLRDRNSKSPSLQAGESTRLQPPLAEVTTGSTGGGSVGNQALSKSILGQEAIDKVQKGVMDDLKKGKFEFPKGP